MLIWCSVGWWHSVTEWARLRSLRCPSGLSSLCLPEPKAEQPDGHELCVWDLKISRRGSACSADATVQGKLVDAALCLPLGLSEIRKSGLDSVLSLLSSGSTCFLTLDLFFCHLLSWQWLPAHLCVLHPSLCFIILPRSSSSSDDSFHVHPGLTTPLLTQTGKLIFLFEGNGNF